MATALIETGACVGALGGLLHGRACQTITAASYDAISAAAESIADEVVAKCAGVTLADADNAAIQSIVQSITYAMVSNRSSTSVVDADYAGLAAAICAAAKSAAAIVP
jgi:hypothetical protein